MAAIYSINSTHQRLPSHLACVGKNWTELLIRNRQTATRTSSTLVEFFHSKNAADHGDVLVVCHVVLFRFGNSVTSQCNELDVNVLLPG